MDAQQVLHEALSEYARDFPDTEASLKERIAVNGGGTYTLAEVVVDDHEYESEFELAFSARLLFKGGNGFGTSELRAIMTGRAVLMIPGRRWAIDEYFLVNPYRSLLSDDNDDSPSDASFL